MFVDVKTVLSQPMTPKWICAVLSIGILWQLFSGIVSLSSVDRADLVRNHQVAKSKLQPNKVTLNSSLNTAFFGDYVPNNLNDAGVKQSMLNLKVVGIMYSNSEGDSHVMIRMAGGREQLYKVGDSLPGGAIIKRITSEGVLIGRNGVLERLNFPKNALTFEPPPKPLGISH